jgi:hypothetical protein
MDAVIKPLNVSAEYRDRISKGDIPPKITDSYNGDFNEVKNNLNVCIDAVNALVDTGTLVHAAAEGRLDVRADAANHQGDFRKIVQGVNDTDRQPANELMRRNGACHVRGGEDRRFLERPTGRSAPHSSSSSHTVSESTWRITLKWCAPSESDVRGVDLAAE